MSEQQTQPLIDVEGLTLKTPMGMVYQDVSFKVGQGQVCAFFGEAGCGKTALLLTICGRMKESSGSAHIAGLELRRDYRTVRRNSAISFIKGLNDVQPFLKVKSIMASELSLVGKHGNKENTKAYLQRWGFLDKADVRFDDLDAFDTAYFGIMLACASDPKLLGVDDVQTNLTQHQGIKLVSMLKKLAKANNMTILFGCSEYEIAQHADGIVVLSEDAKAQRQAVLRDGLKNVSVAVFGSGNGVVMPSDGAIEDRHDMRPTAFAEKGGSL